LPGAGDSVYDQLADLEEVIPFGYPTEQFLAQIKNEIYLNVEEQKLEVQKKI